MVQYQKSVCGPWELVFLRILTFYRRSPRSDATRRNVAVIGLLFGAGLSPLCHGGCRVLCESLAAGLHIELLIPRDRAVDWGFSHRVHLRPRSRTLSYGPGSFKISSSTAKRFPFSLPNTNRQPSPYRLPCASEIIRPTTNILPSFAVLALPFPFVFQSA